MPSTREVVVRRASGVSSSIQAHFVEVTRRERGKTILMVALVARNTRCDMDNNRAMQLF